MATRPSFQYGFGMFPLPTATSIQSAFAYPGNDPNHVDYPSPGWRRQSVHWPMLHSLLAGTAGMRAAGQLFLPQEDKEEDAKYNVRLNRAHLYNMLETALDRLVSKPFARPVVIEDDQIAKLDSRIQPLLYNTDGVGTSLTQFAKEIFRKGLEYGLTHVLVDFPATAGGQTFDDETNGGVRPHLIRIDPPNMLGWRTRSVGSAVMLDEIRFREIVSRPDGMYGESEIEQVRVMRSDGTWEVWEREDNRGTWTETGGTNLGDAPHTYPGVPLHTFYTNRTRFMEGEPPLKNLMEINVAHWQTNADVRNALKMVLAAIFYAFGFDDKELQEMVFGGNMFIRTDRSASEAEVGFAEHTGQGLGAGHKELDRLEQQGETLSAQPFTDRSAKSTATGKAIDEGRANTDAQSWITDCEETLEAALETASIWMSAEHPEDLSVDIFSDFSIGVIGRDDSVTLQAARKSGDIDQKTLLEEYKRRNILSDTVNVEDVIAATEDEKATQMENLTTMLDEEEDDPEDPNPKADPEEDPASNLK